ncbi:MAG: ABC transporter ATP-binding protein [Eubacteriales bacterium]
MFKAIGKILVWTDDQRTKIVIGFIFSVLSLLCGVVPFMVTANAIYQMYLDSNGLGEMTMSTATNAFVWIAVSILCRGIFEYCRAVLQDSAAYVISEKERIKVGDKLKKIPLGFFSNEKVGTLNSIMTTELSFFEMLAMSIIDLCANSYIFVTIIIIGFFTINPIIGGIALGGLLISTLGIHFIVKVTSDLIHIKQESLREVTEATIEYTRGLAVVKSFNQQGETVGKFREACNQASKISIKFEKKYGIPNLAHRLGLYLGTCGIMCVAALLANDQTIPMNMWIWMTLYSFTMFNGVEAVNESALVSQMVNKTIDGLQEITSLEDMDKDAKDIIPNNYNIQFKDVRFSYENQEVIKGVSFEILENSTTAIVGSSGSGKTTLCNLIARFYELDSGSITLGGETITNYTGSSLLKNITMVFQNVYLFKDTIGNNIKFGKPTATREEIIEAAKKARCHDFISQLENGYDTVIGEGGNTLSGGEKQRISIARAMLKDANIVILDEATASIDPENEFYIQSAINELTKGKTVIIIAHKLRTIEHADNILVLDKGTVKQQGTHEQLLAEEGIYKNFVEIRKQAEAWSF